MKFMADPAPHSVAEKVFHGLNQENISEKERFQVIADGFAQLEGLFPGFEDSPVKGDFGSSELRIIREIEGIKKDIQGMRADMKALELKVTKEIAETRGELAKEIEASKTELQALELRITREIAASKAELTKEIEAGRAEVKALELKVTQEIAETKAELTKEIEAGRAEVKALELKVTQEIAETKAELTKEIAETNAELTKEIAETQAGIVETQVKIEKSRSSNLRWTVGLLLGFAITNFGAVFGAALALIRVFG